MENKFLKMIEDERKRQIEKEGWTVDHDQEHSDGSLSNAAACYASTEKIFLKDGEKVWPWHPDWDKKEKHSREKQLIIAGALILAELERMEVEQ